MVQKFMYSPKQWNCNQIDFIMDYKLQQAAGSVGWLAKRRLSLNGWQIMDSYGGWVKGRLKSSFTSTFKISCCKCRQQVNVKFSTRRQIRAKFEFHGEGCPSIKDDLVFMGTLFEAWLQAVLCFRQITFMLFHGFHIVEEKHTVDVCFVLDSCFLSKRASLNCVERTRDIY